MSIEAFLYFFQHQKIIFLKVTNWPDSYEGGRLELSNRISPGNEFSKNKLEDFYGCCWSLERVDPKFFGNTIESKHAHTELDRLGSVAMWGSYCKNGGVRIKTTIGKIINVLNSDANQDFKTFHGKVKYEAASYFSEKPVDPISTLFIKRFPFFYESEYRFILINGSQNSNDIREFNVGGFLNFVDECLISPAANSKKWVPGSLFSLINNITCIPGFGANMKNGQKFCRISSLYGHITEEN